MTLGAYSGKDVLVTGHTGFKGSWLCEMLLLAGARVHGYALEPETDPSLFRQLDLERRISSHCIGDVRDLDALCAYVRRVRPQFVFHLAAQPLVRRSYREPVETFAANVMGTVNLLEAVRRVYVGSSQGACSGSSQGTCSVVCITTDKCYENDNSGRPFREDDPLGGSDPYSASKGACEIAIASYRRSFFSAPDSSVRLASARAGNVVGGGDWAEDRIVPDAMRAVFGSHRLQVRNSRATRPWQHVLEPLSGYLALGAALDRPECRRAFNFGPDPAAVRTVGDLVNALRSIFPDVEVDDHTDPYAPLEAHLLQLDSTLAHKLLNWHSQWDFDHTISETALWYQQVSNGKDPILTTQAQIRKFI